MFELGTYVGKLENLFYLSLDFFLELLLSLSRLELLSLRYFLSLLESLERLWLLFLLFFDLSLERDLDLLLEESDDDDLDLGIITFT